MWRKRIVSCSRRLDFRPVQNILPEMAAQLLGSPQRPVNLRASTLAHYAVPVRVAHVLVGGMLPAHRRNAVRTRLRAGDAPIAVVVIKE